jgi:intracellular sulfur oxidation DsrE/DsrF family protein
MSVENSSNPEIQKWKYCVLNITLNKKKKETITLVFLDVDIDKMQKQEIENKNPLQVIAEMGEIGWEMVAGSNDLCTIFFKTPKK